MQAPYLLENMQPKWLGGEEWIYTVIIAMIVWLIVSVSVGVVAEMTFGASIGQIVGVALGLIIVLGFGIYDIKMVDGISWDWKKVRKFFLYGLMFGIIGGPFAVEIYNFFGWSTVSLTGELIYKLAGKLNDNGLSGILIFGLIYGLIIRSVGGILFGLMSALINLEPISQTSYPGQRISLSIRNSLFIFLLFGLLIGLLKILYEGLFVGLIAAPLTGLIFSLLFGGGLAIIQHYVLRTVFVINKFLPWRLIPFLDFCTDLIFLRRVGGGYIFIHRLLMEHFAAHNGDKPNFG